ncbi:MAG TPA: hypothetical protein PLN95_01200 [Candidatus Saccharibacteria bacterium]|nr:hypothetical protein [Candidatus Saccharibacteria bacterium]
MDKRVYMVGGLAIFVIVVLTQTPLVATLFSFFIMGMIPGTDLAVPFWVMLILYPLLFVTTLYWISNQRFFIGEMEQPARPVMKTKPAKKKSRTSVARKRAAPKRRTRTAT